MLRIQSLLTISLIAFGAACTVGSGDDPRSSTTTSSGEIRYLDTNGDGVFDAIDVNGDGIPDYGFDLASCQDCDDLHPVAFCANPLIDTNGDGIPDGLDWNCDGIVDVWLNPPTGGGTTTTQDQCDGQTTSNAVQYAIDCKSSGGALSCTCSLNGAVVNTCTTTSSNACQFGGDNCCGF